MEELRGLIIRNEVNVNLGDNTTRTALHWAAQSGQLEAVKYLVEEAGADLCISTSFKKTALDLAAWKGNLKVVQYLLSLKGVNFDKFNGSSAVGLAAKGGHVNVLKYLIKKGADVNSWLYCGRTSLQLAAEYGHFEIIKYLLLAKGGAMFKYKLIEEKDNMARIAIRTAKHHGHYGMVKMLKKLTAQQQSNDWSEIRTSLNTFDPDRMSPSRSNSLNSETNSESL